MVDEERRRQFGLELMASHVHYQAERDRQHGFYMMTCKREQGEREGELLRLDPRDRAGIALAHERYDTATSKAGHIYDRYERRAWARHEAEAAELRLKYGITEVEG